MVTNALLVSAVFMIITTGASLLPDSSPRSTNLHVDEVKVEHRPQQKVLELGSLQSVQVDYGNLSTKPVDVIKEDRYRPGSFFFTHNSALLRYTPGEEVAVVLGSTEFVRPFQHNDGTSKEARFSLIGDLVQYNKTKMAVTDFVNNCVREYDFETDMVSTLIGQCGPEFSTGNLKSGTVVNASTRFLVGPTSIEYMESSRSLIVLDFGYRQIARYDFDTRTARLLGDDLYEKLPNPTYILLNSDDTKLYVTHSYGVSVVDMDTLAVQLLVGEKLNDRGDSNRPLLPGPFRQASVGKLESLTWLVKDQVLASVRPEPTEGLVVLDLHQRVVTSHCVGSEDSIVTITGDSQTCSLNSPTALAATDNTIYLATLAKGNYDSYEFSSPSLWFSMTINRRFCTLPDAATYHRVRPRKLRYSPQESVKIRCRGGKFQTLTCLPSTSGSAKWDNKLPDCGQVMTNLRREFSRKLHKQLN